MSALLNCCRSVGSDAAEPPVLLTVMLLCASVVSYFFVLRTAVCSYCSVTLSCGPCLLLSLHASLTPVPLCYFLLL